MRGGAALGSACLLAAVAGIAMGCEPEVIIGRGLDVEAEPPPEPDPPVPWSAHHEIGDLSEWTGDGFGWRYVTDGGSLVSAAGFAHGGSQSLVSVLTGTGATEQAVVGRRARLAEGYYTAWFFLPTASAQVGRVLFKLSSSDPYADRFDLSAAVDGSGVLRLRLFDHSIRGYITELDAVPVLPVETWFEIQAYYRSSPAADGRLVVWQNGALIIDTGPRVTADDDQVTFILGSVSELHATSSAATYVDDAAIRAGQYLPAP